LIYDDPIMLKSAVIGTGFMGITHVEALRRLGIEVVGLLGINDEETRSAVAKLSLLKAYSGLEELLADPEISVVHICTPNYLHYPMAKAALEAGKHVLCEKPLANNSQEADELVRLEKDSGLVGAVNYNLRFYPLNEEARERIQAGEMGEINIIHGEYCQDWLLLPTDWNWRLEPELGGDLRVVADIGTHWMDLVTWLTKLEILAVFADFYTFLPTRYKPIREQDTFTNKLSTSVNNGEPVQIHTEDYAAMFFEFSNGARGTLMLSQISPGRKNDCRWEINGSKSSMSWRQENPNELWIGHREKPNELLLLYYGLMVV
jgi:predicted dehydrogenase